MKFGIVGVGGVGGYFGGLLARAGYDVTFVARGPQYTALKNTGLTVRSVEGDSTVSPITVVDSAAALPECDVILITTKTYNLAEVVMQLAEIINAETIVIPIQNGIDNDLRIKELLPRAQAYPGLAYIISARTTPGVIEQTAGPRTLIFGDRESANNPRLQQLETLMREAGILATCAANIEHELWTKFLWITTFAGITAVTRSAIGPIVNDPDALEWYIRVLDEGISVARALGITISQEMRASIIEKSEHYKHTGTHAKSSLLIDIEHKRQTEIDALNGTMVRLAKEHGLRVPIHESIYHAVRLATKSYSESV